jgi:hypothetical protein
MSSRRKNVKSVAMKHRKHLFGTKTFLRASGSCRIIPCIGLITRRISRLEHRIVQHAKTAFFLGFNLLTTLAFRQS